MLMQYVRRIELERRRVQFNHGVRSLARWHGGNDDGRVFFVAGRAVRTGRWALFFFNMLRRHVAKRFPIADWYPILHLFVLLYSRSLNSNNSHGAVHLLMPSKDCFCRTSGS